MTGSGIGRPHSGGEDGRRIVILWAVDLFLVKRRMRCAEAACPRRTFTEWVPQVPPRCVITRRLLEHAAAEVTDRRITPAEAGRDAGISWPSVHGRVHAGR